MTPYGQRIVMMAQEIYGPAVLYKYAAVNNEFEKTAFVRNLFRRAVSGIRNFFSRSASKPNNAPINTNNVTTNADNAVEATNNTINNALKTTKDPEAQRAQRQELLHKIVQINDLRSDILRNQNAASNPSWLRRNRVPLAAGTLGVPLVGAGGYGTYGLARGIFTDEPIGGRWLNPDYGIEGNSPEEKYHNIMNELNRRRANIAAQIAMAPTPEKVIELTKKLNNNDFDDFDDPGYRSWFRPHHWLIFNPYNKNQRHSMAELEEAARRQQSAMIGKVQNKVRQYNEQKDEVQRSISAINNALEMTQNPEVRRQLLARQVALINRLNMLQNNTENPHLRFYYDKAREMGLNVSNNGNLQWSGFGRI